MLNTTQISLRTVLISRRKQFGLRMAATLALIIDFGLLVGWGPVLAFYGAYLALQAVEYVGFAPARRWATGQGWRSQLPILCLLALNSLTFGAPGLIVAYDLGSVGVAPAAYMICGTILNAALTTIGCRSAFLASGTPYLAYLCILPFTTASHAARLTWLILFSMLGCGVFLCYSVWLTWRGWSQRKSAEIEAARRYIAERDQTERRLSAMSQQDALTGLLNRNVLRARLAQTAHEGQAGTLLMIDLDGFKYVNDTLGHSAGDKVLRDVAERIRAAGGLHDTAARLGGDEFALLLPDLTDPVAAIATAERLIEEISLPVRVDHEQINIGASIGIVIHPLHGNDPEQLFTYADLALYEAKAEGRHCSRLYHPEMRARAQGKVLRDTELRLALERGEFEMFYQPQVRLSDRRLTGAEALLRWRHPELGLLTAGEIPEIAGNRPAVGQRGRLGGGNGLPPGRDLAP